MQSPVPSLPAFLLNSGQLHRAAYSCVNNRELLVSCKGRFSMQKIYVGNQFTRQHVFNRRITFLGLHVSFVTSTPVD